MKRTRKLLAAALAAVFALMMLSGCSQTEYIYNTIVTPAAEPDPMTVYYVQVIDEAYRRQREDETRDDESFGKPVTILASAELDQKAKEAVALIENGMSEEEAVREVMKGFVSGEDKVLCGRESINMMMDINHIWQSFGGCRSIDPKDNGVRVGDLNRITYPAFKVGTATYEGEVNSRLIIVAAYCRFLYDRRT